MLNIASLYRDKYLDYFKEKNVSPVSEDKYKQIFNEKYNIGFKLPKSDTCKTCDMIHIKLSNLTTRDERRGILLLQKEKELHLRRMHGKLTQFTAEAKTHPDRLHTINIDPQQTLPTPILTCGHAFYLRKLWTYNVGIHDCGKNQGYMFMWDKSTAKRGSEEIGSCLPKYITCMNIKSERLAIFSDNCGGQNKNYNLVGLYNYLISTKVFKEFVHCYLIAGRTFTFGP